MAFELIKIIFDNSHEADQGRVEYYLNDNGDADRQFTAIWRDLQSLEPAARAAVRDATEPVASTGATR